jgi:hypothetical protein
MQQRRVLSDDDFNAAANLDVEQLQHTPACHWHLRQAQRRNSA